MNTDLRWDLLIDFTLQMVTKVLQRLERLDQFKIAGVDDRLSEAMSADLEAYTQERLLRIVDDIRVRASGDPGQRSTPMLAAYQAALEVAVHLQMWAVRQGIILVDLPQLRPVSFDQMNI